MSQVAAQYIDARSESPAAAILSNARSLLLAAVAFYVVVLPSYSLSSTLSDFDEKRLFEIGLLSLNAGLLLASSTLRDEWRQVAADIPALGRCLLLGVFLVGFCSALQADVARYAFLEVTHYALLMALFLSTAVLWKTVDRSAEAYLLGLIVVAVSLYLVKVASSYAFGLTSPESSTWPESGLGFSHVRFLNQFQTWTLPLIVVPMLWMWKRSRAIAYMFCALASLWWMCLFATGGRGTTLSVAIAIVAAKVIFRRHARDWAGAQLICAAAGALLYVLFFQIITQPGASLFDRQIAADSGRFILWAHALDLATSSPWLGVGPMHYAYYALQEHAAHPHNIVLQWMSEWGLAATAMAVAAVMWAFRSWIRSAQRVAFSAQQRPFTIAITATLIAAAVHSLFSGLLVTPYSQVLFAVIGGLAAGYYQVANPRPVYNPPRSEWHHRSRDFSICMGLLLLVCAWTWGFSGDLLRLKERHMSMMKTDNIMHVGPRYWQMGYIKDSRGEVDLNLTH